MTDQQLRTLLAIAACGSFTRAEHTLFLSKQAIKKQIDALEKELGFPLFLRSYQGVELTPAGKEFVRGAERLIGDLDALVDSGRRRSSEEQVIRIANPDHPRLLLERAFAAFACRYPQVRQQVILRDWTCFVEDLLGGRIDVAECILKPELLRPGIAYRPLFAVPYKCLLSPQHPLAARERLELQDLQGFRLAILASNTRLIEEIRRAAPDTAVEILRDNDLQKVYSLCYDNCIFISKAYYVSHMEPLVAVPLACGITAVAAILYRKDPAPLVRMFLDVVEQIYPPVPQALAAGALDLHEGD